MAKKNFTITTVATAPSPATSGTSLVVASGTGSLFAINEPAIVFPVNNQPLVANAEIVMVTNVTTDTLTITREQESTSARTITAGDIIIQGITAKDWNDLITAVAGKITAFADPNADRIVFWDDSAGAFAALTASTGLTLSGTTLTVRSASETATGIVERATDAEFTGGTDTTMFVNAKQVASVAQTMTNKTIESPVINTGVSGTAILDEDDMASNSATKLATQQSIKAYVDSRGLDGWIPISGTYNIGTDAVGLDVIEIDGDATGYLSAGMRIKVTQDATVYYGIIHYVTYSIPDSDTKIGIFLSVSSGTRNRLNGNAVSNMYYSREKCPYGFPTNPQNWTVSLTKTTDSTINNPTSGWKNLSNETNLTVPVGCWLVGYRGVFGAGGGDSGRYVSLGATNSTPTARFNAFTFGYAHHTVQSTELLSVETVFYLNMLRNSALTFMGSITGATSMGETYVYAINNYL